MSIPRSVRKSTTALPPHSERRWTLFHAKLCLCVAVTGCDRLLPLPPFLLAGGAAEWDDIFAAFRLTGHFLARDLLIERQADILAARERLMERLRRVTR